MHSQPHKTHFAVTKDGSVGIGTANPNDGKIEVKGGTVCVDTDSNDLATSCIANELDERLKTNIQSFPGIIVARHHPRPYSGVFRLARK